MRAGGRALLGPLAACFVACAGPAFVAEEPIAARPVVAPSETELPQPAPELPTPEPPPPSDEARDAMRAMRWPSHDLRVHERACVDEYMVPDEEGPANIEGYTDYRFDDGGRLIEQHWNSDAVGLSGEIRHRYDGEGERIRTDEIPYESIEGGRPPRPAPITYRYERTADAVTRIATRRRQTLRTERFRFDAADRVIEHVVESDDSEESRRVECTYDERGRPSARVRHRGERVLRDEYVYDDDRLVEVRFSSGDHAFVRSIWSIEGGFAVYEGEAVERYRGSCAEVFFEDCSSILAPARAAGRARAALPAIRFGRPIGP